MKALATCIKCKNVTSCEAVSNSKYQKWDYYCDACIYQYHIHPTKEDVVRLGWQKAYRKEYYKRTGR
jgi:hypothetical protein